LIAQAGSYTEEQLEDGVLTITTNIKHKHGQPVPVHMKVTMGGESSQMQSPSYPGATLCCSLASVAAW
jgi:hypothetical protein